jgi:hypothetical protein
MTDAKTNNIKTIENAFVSNMGSGKQAAIKLAQLIDMSRTSEDSRSLANALTRLKKADDSQGYSATKKIILAIFPKATAKASKDKKSIIIKDMMVEVNDKAIERLIDGVKQGLSIRSTLAAIVADDSPKEYDLIKSSDQAVAKAMKNGITEAALVAAIKASYEKARKAEASK